MALHPILIRKITHLTDARYFAAMGVDWMSIELTHDPLSFQRWHSLREWLQGIRLVAEIHVVDEMLLAKTIIEASPDALLFSGPTDLSLPDDVPLFFDVSEGLATSYPEASHMLFPFEPGQSWPDIDPHLLFLQADWTGTMIASLLESGYQGGICLTGGEEQVTGIRDYEKMDEMIQMLRQLD